MILLDKFMWLVAVVVVLAGIVCPICLQPSLFPSREETLQSELILLHQKLQTLECRLQQCPQDISTIQLSRAKTTKSDLRNLEQLKAFCFLTSLQEMQIREILMSGNPASVRECLHIREIIEFVLTPMQRKLYIQYLQKYQLHF